MVCPKNLLDVALFRDWLGREDKSFFKKGEGVSVEGLFEKGEQIPSANYGMQNFLHPEIPLAFLLFKIMEDIKPNQEALSTNTKSL